MGVQLSRVKEVIKGLPTVFESLRYEHRQSVINCTIS